MSHYNDNWDYYSLTRGAINLRRKSISELKSRLGVLDKRDDVLYKIRRNNKSIDEDRYYSIHNEIIRQKEEIEKILEIETAKEDRYENSDDYLITIGCVNQINNGRYREKNKYGVEYQAFFRPYIGTKYVGIECRVFDEKLNSGYAKIVADTSTRNGVINSIKLIGHLEMLKSLLNEDSEWSLDMKKNIQIAINSLDDSIYKFFDIMQRSIYKMSKERSLNRCKMELSESLNRVYGLNDLSVKKKIEKETGVPTYKQPKHLVEAWLVHRQIKHEIKQLNNEKHS
jgi:hypothetical protein